MNRYTPPLIADEFVDFIQGYVELQSLIKTASSGVVDRENRLLERYYDIVANHGKKSYFETLPHRLASAHLRISSSSIKQAPLMV